MQKLESLFFLFSISVSSRHTKKKNLRANKKQKFDENAKRIQSLEQKVLYVEKREQEGWRVAAQQLNDLTEQSQGGTSSIANLEIRLSRELQRLEDTIGKELDVEVQRRTVAEKRSKDAISHAAAEVREAIAQLESNRFSVIDKKIDDMATTVSELCSVFDSRIGE